jgi:copper(I)-binding protein
MKSPVRLLFLAAVLPCLSPVAMSAELAFHDAWVAAAPHAAKTQAAYICFINNSDKDVEITGVSAQGYGTAVIHMTMQHGDMTMMHVMSSLVVPAHQMVTLEPGGTHIMLMDPVKIASAGEKVAITVRYSDNTSQVFELEVKTSDQVPAKEHAHQEHDRQ